MLLKVRWFSWGVSISHVMEDSVLATLLSALSPNLTRLEISGEQRKYIHMDSLSIDGLIRE